MTPRSRRVPNQSPKRSPKSPAAWREALILVEKIIEIEKPDALLPTLGGQTALNLAKDAAERGVLRKHNVELIGAKLPAIQKAEDREIFKELMVQFGLDVPMSGTVTSTVRVALDGPDSHRVPRGSPLSIPLDYRLHCPHDRRV